MAHRARVPLAALRREARLWPREQLCDEHVRTLEEIYRHEGPDRAPPILIAPADPQGQNLLIDGWHRVQAAERAGLAELPAEVRRVAGDEEAYELAVRASSRGTRPMTRAEKRAAVDRLLAAGPSRSDRAIAEIAGVSHPTVAQRRALMGKPKQGPREGIGAAQPGRQARLLLQAAERLQEACETADRAQDAEAIEEAIIGALAGAAERQFGGAAGEWLRRLEGWAHAARGGS